MHVLRGGGGGEEEEEERYFVHTAEAPLFLLLSFSQSVSQSVSAIQLSLKNKLERETQLLYTSSTILRGTTTTI